MESLSVLGLSVRKVDARERFLGALAGIHEPEEKRKRIGEAFIRVFETEVAELGDVPFLVQGTLYPDVIESGHGGHKKAHNIKTHHNVGGLPADSKFRLVEPLRQLFKDEVRRVGREMGIDNRLLERQPFPGPGMAVRCLGEVREDRLKVVCAADAIVREELDRLPLEGPGRRLWQYFAALFGQIGGRTGRSALLRRGGGCSSRLFGRRHDRPGGRPGSQPVDSSGHPHCE